MDRFDTDRDLASLRELSLYADRLIAEHTSVLALSAPAVSAWSVEHQLAHLALANELCLKNVASLARGSGLLVVEGGEPVAGAREMLLSGRIPRGAAQSPRMVRPPAEVERALLREWQASNLRAVEALLGTPGSVRASAKKIPHQLLGALDAAEWARFAAVHTRHHLAIARDVLLAHAIEASELPALALAETSTPARPRHQADVPRAHGGSPGSRDLP